MTMCRFLWPRRGNVDDVNPPYAFAGYENSVYDIEHAGPSAEDDSTLLAQSWKIFDNESTRRNSIDSRAGALMPAIGLVASLVTGIGFTAFKDAAIPLNPRWVILVTYVLALIYLVRTMLLLFVVHGRIFRYTPDPSDLSPTPPAAGTVSRYDRDLACKIMRYTIDNYQINNVQADALFVAQQTFRNAILAIAIGGTIAGVLMFWHMMTPPSEPVFAGLRTLTCLVTACPAIVY
jgi:hypothetical protein